MWLVEFSLAHRIPVACFSCHKINKISISCLNYSRKQEILLKNLLQNQQNLKARGIYSCTGIYFFKSAIISDQESPSISDLPCRDLLYPASLSSSGQPRNQLLFSSLPDNRQQTVDFPLQSSQSLRAELPRH